MTGGGGGGGKGASVGGEVDWRGGGVTLEEAFPKRKS